MNPIETDGPLARREVERIRWPDGPVCPYCGERESLVAAGASSDPRVRYECRKCGAHRGYIRRPGGSTASETRRSVLPRFPA